MTHRGRKNGAQCLDGEWVGTEVGAVDPRGEYHGSVRARLSLKAGAGTYTVYTAVGTPQHSSTVEPSEVRSDGCFAAGHIRTGAELHGSFEAQANATHLWGSWATYGSQRIYLWAMRRSAPAPPPAPPCGSLTTPAACAGQTDPSVPRCFWHGAKCISRVTQVDIVEHNTTAPWGTLYACFRIPSAVQTPDGTLLVFFESRIGSCNDQAPKDVTFKHSRDGVAWSELMLAVGPVKHAECAFEPASYENCLDFSARNPFATVTDEGDVLLGYSNSTSCPGQDPLPPHNLPGCATNYQTLLRSRSGWKPAGPITRVDMGDREGVLAGPGNGIVLGRHSANSPHKGRWVGCGSTYIGSKQIVMPVWYSDDSGATYTFATGGGLPFKGIGECQAVELRNGSVMINARNEAYGCPNFPNCKPHHRLYAISDDGGSTFGAPQFAEDLPEPICSAGLANHGGTLFFSNPDSTSERTHMTLKSSTDSGESWQVDTPIFGGQSAYSVVVSLNDAARVGVVYERGEASPYERVTLAIVALAKPATTRVKADDHGATHRGEKNVVLDYHADPTGARDSTAEITRAHETASRVFYPDGRYRFNGEVLKLAQGSVRFESAQGVLVHNNLSTREGVLNFDDAGNLIGLQQNHLEWDNLNHYTGSEPMQSGSLVPPPLSTAAFADRRAAVLGHWYNDGGLETRRANPGSGWIGWYYWSWAFHHGWPLDASRPLNLSSAYDPSRHPLLGFCKSDSFSLCAVVVLLTRNVTRQIVATTRLCWTGSATGCASTACKASCSSAARLPTASPTTAARRATGTPHDQTLF